MNNLSIVPGLSHALSGEAGTLVVLQGKRAHRIRGYIFN
jgi:hypothetical protein